MLESLLVSATCPSVCVVNIFDPFITMAEVYISQSMMNNDGYQTIDAEN